MEIKRVLCFLAVTVILAACGGSRQGAAPGVSGTLPTLGATGALQTARASGHTAGHLILMGGMRPDGKCPRVFTECVTISSHQSAQLYFCYSQASYCGPSQPQYGWYWTFNDRHGDEVYFLYGSFNPNPGNPTYDTIGEAYGVPPTHGKYRYAQIVCPFLGSSCLAYFYIGIAIK